MVSLEEIARIALDGDPLFLRGVVQEWLGTRPTFADVARPETRDTTVLAMAAALAELFALRTRRAGLASGVPGVLAARYLVRSAATMKHMRRMCAQDSPWPLKRRNLYAPANYLKFA